ncbi:hypothetical protein [Brevundimonas sp.]|uniref:hypothetical protein n=1 Tax=Brevundimonas sp. TaxID=1871086 RepID=UPI0035B3EBAB
MAIDWKRVADIPPPEGKLLLWGPSDANMLEPDFTRPDLWVLERIYVCLNQVSNPRSPLGRSFFTSESKHGGRVQCWPVFWAEYDEPGQP